MIKLGFMIWIESLTNRMFKTSNLLMCAWVFCCDVLMILNIIHCASLINFYACEFVDFPLFL